MKYDTLNGGEFVVNNEDQQLSLGNLIEDLCAFPEHMVVKFVGTDYSPSKTSCYRGYYEDLALNYSNEDKTVKEVLQILKDTIGKVYTGYKGGEYKMQRFTRVWAARDSGNCSNMKITSVFLDEGVVLLGTVEERF